MGLCSPGVRAVAVQSAFNVRSGFGFGGGAAAQGNSSVKAFGKFLVSNWVIVSARLDSLFHFGPLNPPPLKMHHSAHGLGEYRRLAYRMFPYHLRCRIPSTVRPRDWSHFLG